MKNKIAALSNLGDYADTVRYYNKSLELVPNDQETIAVRDLAIQNLNNNR